MEEPEKLMTPYVPQEPVGEPIPDARTYCALHSPGLAVSSDWASGWNACRAFFSASPAAPEVEKHPDEFMCPLCFDDPNNIKDATQSASPGSKAQQKADAMADAFLRVALGPKTQAGEPKTAGYQHEVETFDAQGYSCYKRILTYHPKPVWHGGHEVTKINATEPLITLQSYREALQDQTIGYEKTIDKLNEAIARKDAALKARVEALEYYAERGNWRPSPDSKSCEIRDGEAWTMAEAAITKAQEALK